jgi:hypothetical protein
MFRRWKNVVQGLAKSFVKGSNWHNVEATIVAPATFAINEFRRRIPHLKLRKAAIVPDCRGSVTCFAVSVQSWGRGWAQQIQ